MNGVLVQIGMSQQVIIGPNDDMLKAAIMEYLRIREVPGADKAFDDFEEPSDVYFWFSDKPIIAVGGKVEIEAEDDSVTIRDQWGREVVHWVGDEFEEDRAAAFAACNAIQLFHTEGVAAIAALIGKDISHPDYISFRNHAGNEVRYLTADLVSHEKPSSEVTKQGGSNH